MQHHAAQTLLLANVVGRGGLAGPGRELVYGTRLFLGRSARLGGMWGKPVPGWFIGRRVKIQEQTGYA